MQNNILVMISITTIIIVIFSLINEKLLRLPSEIGLMTIAFALSLSLIALQLIGIDFTDTLTAVLNPFNVHDIILEGIICFLLFAGAAKIKFKDLTSDKYLISSLAFFSTLLAAVIYGALAYLVANLLAIKLTFIQGLMLGSIIAPTDPVSAMGILKKAGLSHRVSMIIEGESLFNDGIGVALFVTFSAINQQAGSSALITTFIKTISIGIFGAVLIGLLVSFIFFALFRYTHYKHLEILISISAVTTAYSVSEFLQASAPIAAVIVGIYFATMMHKYRPEWDRFYVVFYAFWEVIDKTLNGILYIIIGFAILLLHGMPNFVITMITAIAIGLIARLISLILPLYFFSRNVDIQPYNYRGDHKRKDIRAMLTLLTWGGLKGGISIALVLGTSSGLTSSQYDFFVASTYAVVAFSILVQGMTIKPLYNKLKGNFAEG